MLKYYTYTHRTIGPFIYLEELDNGFAKIQRLRDGRKLTGRVMGRSVPWEHPQPQKLREVANAFDRMGSIPSNRLDFSRGFRGFTPTVPGEHPCGTVACHAGWAGIFLEVGVPFYTAGAKALCKHLCPWWDDEEGDDFPAWASAHPRLWGNPSGLSMFGSCGFRAFGFKEGQPCTLRDIANHYHQVANRIEAIL